VRDQAGEDIVGDGEVDKPWTRNLHRGAHIGELRMTYRLSGACAWSIGHKNKQCGLRRTSARHVGEWFVSEDRFEPYAYVGGVENLD
jgi:hypothetical protein